MLVVNLNQKTGHRKRVYANIHDNGPCGNTKNATLSFRNCDLIYHVVIKGIVHQKMKILSLINHPSEYKLRYFTTLCVKMTDNVKV